MCIVIGIKYSMLHLDLSRRVKFRCCIYEGDYNVLPESQVYNREDVDGHEREHDDADEDIANFREAIVYEPTYKTSAKIIDVDADDAQSKYPWDYNDLQHYSHNKNNKKYTQEKKS